MENTWREALTPGSALNAKLLAAAGKLKGGMQMEEAYGELYEAMKKRIQELGDAGKRGGL